MESHGLWVEKYRPQDLSTYVGNEHLKTKVERFIIGISVMSRLCLLVDGVLLIFSILFLYINILLIAIGIPFSRTPYITGKLLYR